MAGPAAFFTWFRDKFVNLVLPLMPNSLQEIFLFIVMVVLIIVIVDLLIYTNIQRRIRNDSRCYQENKENQRSYGDYVSFVKTKDGDLVGTLSYDPVSGDTKFNDNCQQLLTASKTGEAATQVPIPVHTRINGKTESFSRVAECPSAIGSAARAGLTYEGNTEYVKFLKEGGTLPTR